MNSEARLQTSVGTSTVSSIYIFFLANFVFLVDHIYIVSTVIIVAILTFSLFFYILLHCCRCCCRHHCLGCWMWNLELQWHLETGIVWLSICRRGIMVLRFSGTSSTPTGTIFRPGKIQSYLHTYNKLQFTVKHRIATLHLCSITQQT